VLCGCAVILGLVPRICFGWRNFDHAYAREKLMFTTSLRRAADPRDKPEDDAVVVLPATE
jgi:hypothetical protein